MLRVHDLTKSFTNHLRPQPHTRTVLRGVSLDVPTGACIALTGASGSGKSSLLRCVYGTYAADSGQALVPGLAAPPAPPAPPGDTVVDVVGADPRTLVELRRHSMGMVTQFLSVPPRIPALDLVVDAARDDTGHHRPTPVDHDGGRGRGEGATARARELLARLGLAPELHDQAPATFSGGERQLVNIAIALARPRPLLLVDEATASLDPTRRDSVLAALREHKDAGTALLAIFHDVPDLPGLVDEVCHLSHGLIQENR